MKILFDDLSNKEIDRYIGFNNDRFGIFKYPYMKDGLFYRNEKLFGTEFAEKCQDEYIDILKDNSRFIVVLCEIFKHRNVIYRCDEYITIDEFREKMKDIRLCVFVYSNVIIDNVMYFKCKIHKQPIILGGNELIDFEKNKGIYPNDLKYDGFYSNLYSSDINKCDIDYHFSESTEIINNENCLVAITPIFRYNDHPYSCSEYLTKTQIIEKMDKDIIVVIYDCYTSKYHRIYKCQTINKIKE